MKPKLTLRDLFWLTLVCAMGCAWWTQRQLLLGQLTEQESALEEANRRASLPRVVKVDGFEYALKNGYTKMVVEFTETGVRVEKQR